MAASTVSASVIEYHACTVHDEQLERNLRCSHLNLFPIWLSGSNLCGASVRVKPYFRARIAARLVSSMFSTTTCPVKTFEIVNRLMCGRYTMLMCMIYENRMKIEMKNDAAVEAFLMFEILIFRASILAPVSAAVVAETKDVSAAKPSDHETSKISKITRYDCFSSKDMSAS